MPNKHSPEYFELDKCSWWRLFDTIHYNC